MTIRRGLVCGVAVCVLATALWARPGIVKHRDGSTYTGDVSEEEAGKVVVRVRDIPIAIDRRDVVSIQYGEPGEDFQKKLAAAPPGDVKSRLDLAKWAMGERKYQWATQAAEAALVIDPNNREATDLIAMIRRQQQLEQARPAPARPNPGDATGGAAATRPAPDRKTLADDDINLIRQSELGMQENNFRVEFANDVRRQYIKQINGNLQQFSAQPVQQQAREIIRQAPELRNDVRIVTDPTSMVMFKQRVQPAVLAGCASSGCHSGQTGGGFVLLNGPDNEAQTYTNFFILNQYAKMVNNARLGMIERTTPQRSLLLQYGLPPENAEVKHPPAGNYRGLFRTQADPRFKAIVDWLGTSLQVPAPDYAAIKYEAPTNASATPPATAPSK